MHVNVRGKGPSIFNHHGIAKAPQNDEIIRTIPPILGLGASTCYLTYPITLGAF